MYQRNSSPRQRSQNPATQQPHNSGSTAPQYQQLQQGYQPVYAAGAAQPQQTAQNTNQQHQQSQQNDPQPSHFASPPGNDSEYISGTISRRSTDKVAMDFSDRLVKAYSSDYANIHGCGGKKHAPNSGIQLSICDFSKGKGSDAITVSAIIDVREVSYLYEAVKQSAFGMLGLHDQMKAVREFATANGVLIGWLQSNHQPTLQEIATLQQTVCTGLMAQDPDNVDKSKITWTHTIQKANPWSTQNINGVEYATTTFVNVLYSPGKDYSWTMQVINCDAPLVRRQNGASYAKYSQAINKKEAMFHMTTLDLFCALSDVEHYILLWENRMFRTVDAMCTERERRAEVKRNQKG